MQTDRLFIIEPHGRLADWVAAENKYFEDEGLNYFINSEAGYKSTPEFKSTFDATNEIKDDYSGAYEKYKSGDGRKGDKTKRGDISCACHWTVNHAAKTKSGIMYGKAYSMCDSAIMVPKDSNILSPVDLYGFEIAVGYHSGSHYSAIQALEAFIDIKGINLKFLGGPWSRVDSAVSGESQAVNVWGPQLYLLEQLGWRRLLPTTFMMGYIFPEDTNSEDVEKYISALIRAQSDIDQHPEKFKHYYKQEIPARYTNMIDIRLFDVGERVVKQPYTRQMFEDTQKWMHERGLFKDSEIEGIAFEQAVYQ